MSLKSRILSHFITRVKEIKRLSSSSLFHDSSFHQLPDDFPTYGSDYAKMIFIVVQAALNSFASFKEELEGLCNYLIESDNSQIGKVLFWLSTQPAANDGNSKSNHDGFKLFADAYLHHLSTSKLTQSNLDELATLAEIMLRSTKPFSVKYVNICHGLEDNNILCILS